MDLRRALIVDHDPNVQTSLRELFEDRGFHVTLVDSTRRAFDILDDSPIDVFVSRGAGPAARIVWLRDTHRADLDLTLDDLDPSTLRDQLERALVA